MNQDALDMDAVVFGQVFAQPHSLLLLTSFVVILFCSYVKIATVLSVLRSGFGFFSVPSALVTGGLALVLAFFIVYPTLGGIAVEIDGQTQEQDGRLEAHQVAGIILSHWKRFLVLHAGEAEKQRLKGVALQIDGKTNASEAVEQTVADDSSKESIRVLLPAFVITELREAFATGITILLPFFVIDLLVASLLAGMGLLQVSPYSAALPLKLLLFVMLDGWNMLTANLLASYAN